MTHVEKMEKLLQFLLENGAQGLQLVLQNGQIVAGAVKKSAIEGVYQIRTMLKKPGTQQLSPCDVYFTAETLFNVTHAIDSLVEPATDFRAYCGTSCVAGLSYLVDGLSGTRLVGLGVGFAVGNIAGETLETASLSDSAPHHDALKLAPPV